jgi:hypothetical protein
MLMSNLINPKPRFGFNPDTKTMYDYVTQRDVAIVSSYAAPDGNWNLALVRDLILGGQTIEGARLSIIKPQPAPVAKVAGATPAAKAAAASPAATANAATSSQVATAQAHANLAAHKPAPAALSNTALKALALTPVQMASLRITPAQVSGGLTSADIAALKISVSRAKMLGLNAVQSAALVS